MSNFLAIATVTAVIKSVLENTMVDSENTGLSDVQVTTLRPEKLDSNISNDSMKGVNLYLYQVTPNTALRNVDLPCRNSNGKLVQQPLVALDLHYLVTFYGDDKMLEPQRLLGIVVRTFHTSPILTHKVIEKAIEYLSNSNENFSFLQNSDLADALETIKITPVTLSLEELSKLWSVFFQTPYRLSVAYIASVVLIESEEVPQSVLPVRDRNLYVMPFHQPVIEKVLSADGADKFIVAKSKLVIRGKNLRGDVTLAKVNGKEVKPEKDMSDIQITISLPSDLRAGVHGLQIVHKMLMGTPPVLHRGIESNLYAFVLHPTITVPNPDNNPMNEELTISINPMVGKKQRVVLLLNEISSDEAASYTFIDDSREDETDSLKFHVSGVKAADYFVRVQVDGAQSQLIIDPDKNSSTFNQYIDPKVKIS